MDLLSDLTPAQREAASHVDGPMLVLAAAGSGKTRVITRRIAYLLTQGIRGDEILALTFTNKAAGEMRERVEHLAPRSKVWVGTFHGFCARLLRTHGPVVGLDRGFTIYDQADRLRVLKQVMEPMGLDNVGVTPERVEAAISRAKNEMVLPEHYARSARHMSDHVSAVVTRAYPEYQKRLKELSAVDFDDLLIHVVGLLKTHPELRARLDQQFRYILVDEYQDTNLAQYAILRGLSVDHKNLCVTGDPDQSIYGWRGANLSNILEFEQDYPGCKVVRLERNYRSTKSILEVADHLIRHNRRRKDKALVTENAQGEPVALCIYENEVDEAEGVVRRIIAATREGEYRYGDVAVFVRMTALTRQFEAAFRAANIPYQIVGGQAFYERLEIKDVLGYLSLLVNPKDDIAFLRVVNNPPRGIGATSLEKLQTHARSEGLTMLDAARRAERVPELQTRAAKAIVEFTQLVDSMAPLRDLSAEEAVRRLLAQTKYHDYWREQAGTKEGADDRLANLDELISAARQFDHTHPGASLVDFLEEISLASAVDRMKDESGAVTLMTLHAAKGLEFPVVFIVGIEQGILPHSRSAGSDAELEEERRLLFVGITRAQRELYLSHCVVREFRGQRAPVTPSMFLEELPAESLAMQDVSRSGSYRSPMRPTAAPRPSFTPRPASSSPPPGFRLITAAELASGRVGGGSLPTAADSSGANFRLNDTVRHQSYGVGKVIGVEGLGENAKVRIRFSGSTEKVFIASKAPIQIVRRG